MKKLAIVYWSGGGNTEKMAEAVLRGANEVGATADLWQATQFDANRMEQYDAVAFGCPSMGAEQLEEAEFEPMFSACEAKIGGKQIALFGSYGWGDGEWMRNWEGRCRADGAQLVCPFVICQGEPDDDATTACRMLGKVLAEA